MSETTGLTVPQEWYVAPGETINVLMSFEPLLAKDLSERLDGTPTVESDPELTITNEAITDRARTINDRKVEAAMAIGCTITGFEADGDYTLTFTCSTTKGQTRVRYATLRCREA